jgi:hypothetical protein
VLANNPNKNGDQSRRFYFCLKKIAKEYPLNYRFGDPALDSTGSH